YSRRQKAERRRQKNNQLLPAFCFCLLPPVLYGFFFFLSLSLSASGALAGKWPLASVISLTSSATRSIAATSSGSVTLIFNEFSWFKYPFAAVDSFRSARESSGFFASRLLTLSMFVIASSRIPAISPNSSARVPLGGSPHAGSSLTSFFAAVCGAPLIVAKRRSAALIKTSVPLSSS